MLTFVKKYGRNVYSQNSEDGVIEECISRMMPKKYEQNAIEIGAPTWTYCSNTAYLADKGWLVDMFDIEPNDARVRKMEINEDNINLLPDSFVLSIDIDNNDYHIWKERRYKDDLVIIEINSGIEPVLDMIPGTQGASYKSMVELGISKGYFLLCHTGNLIWVLNKYKDLFPEVTGDPLKDHDLYFNKSFL